jgi:hypothetical protein
MVSLGYTRKDSLEASSDMFYCRQPGQERAEYSKASKYVQAALVNSHQVSK